MRLTGRDSPVDGAGIFCRLVPRGDFALITFDKEMATLATKLKMNVNVSPGEPNSACPSAAKPGIVQKAGTLPRKIIEEIEECIRMVLGLYSIHKTLDIFPVCTYTVYTEDSCEKYYPFDGR